MDKNLITQFDFFKNINATALDSFLAESVLETIPPDVLLIQQGKTPDWFYFIIDGQVEIYLEENDHTHLANLGAGEYFGEMSVLTGESASASVITTERTTVLKMPRHIFLQLIKICPELNNELMQRLLVRLKQTNQWVSENYRKELTLCNFISQEKKSTYGKFVYASVAMEQVKTQINQQSFLDSPLIILGESGVGKEHTAAMIHYQSKRANHPFIVLNCKLLTKKNWEKILLGSEKEIGKLTLAEGGSLLLKNVEALPSECLQLFYQLLTDVVWRKRVRVMTTSRKSSEDLLAAFGLDLWSLIANCTIVIPPLRNRKEDIPCLARYFVVKHNREKRKSVLHISHESMQLINTYAYLAGNVRELEEIVADAVVNAVGEVITPEVIQFGCKDVHKNGPLKIGLALGGGGARGLAHVGVLEVLEEEQIPIHYVAGTSVGAIVGALYAAGISTKEMKKIISKISWRQLVNLVFPKSGILKTDGIANLINQVMGEKSFDQLEKPFAVVATDVSTGQEVIIRNGTLAPAIRASATLPGIFEPICIDGKYLLDGGLVNNVPASVARAMGADFVIAVDLGGIGEQIPRNLLQLVFHAFAIMAARNEANATEWADIVIKPKLGKYNLADLQFGQEIMKLGEEAALQAIPELNDRLKVLQKLNI